MEAAHVPWRPLGELFVDRGLISEEELETALVEQAATGKRLGEILVDNGLVSGPDLTTTLMEQLGVEMKKEEGYGSGLWAEIKRRHKRARRDDEYETDEPAHMPQISLVAPAGDPEPFVVSEPAEAEPDHEPEPGSWFESAPTLEPATEPVVVGAELEEELEEIRADYTAPAEREPEPAAEGDEAAALRAELDEARRDLARLHEMLADAMTALTALTAESDGESYPR